MMQWHPLFAHLLRPLVEGHYDVQLNLPVGALPREADIVLLRRTASVAGVFHGIWQHLTTWNVLEFKGPTVSARVADMDLLVELGLGVDRHLNGERKKKEQPEVERGEVSLWYLANHLGSRFLRDVQQLAGPFTEVGPGLWRTRILGRSLILVSNREVPVDRDSVPIHLLVEEPVEATRAAAQTIAAQEDLWRMYGGWLATRFPGLWKEIAKMAEQTGTELVIDLRPAIEIAQQTGTKVILDLRPVIERMGIDKVIEQVGIDRLIGQVGIDKVIEQVGIERIVDSLNPDQQQAMLERLQARRGGGKGPRDAGGGNQTSEQKPDTP
jgi:hypothetical protein